MVGVSQIPGQGDISQPLAKEWVRAHPNCTTRRKLKYLNVKRKEVVYMMNEEKMEKLTPSIICLERFLLCVLGRDHVISWSYGVRGRQPSLKKKIRPSEDPFKEGAQKKSTQCGKLPIFWGFQRVCCLTEIGPELMNSGWGSLNERASAVGQSG